MKFAGTYANTSSFVRSLATRVLIGSALVTSLVNAVDSPAVGANLVVNPGFETALDGWTTSSGCTVASGHAFLGANCLEMKFSEGRVERWAGIEFAGKPGRTFRIGARIRTRDLTRSLPGASISLGWVDARGALLGYRASNTLNGTNVWTPVTLDVSVPRHAQRLRLTLIADSSAGTAWFDDVRAVMLDDVDLRLLLRYPNYRGSVDRGAGLQTVFGCEVNDSSTHPLSELALDVSVMTGSGRIVASHQTKPPLAQNYVCLESGLSPLPPGSYKAAAKLTDSRTGALLRTHGVSFRVADQAAAIPRVMIDRHNRCVVGGAPFFPLGLYSSHTTEREIELISDSKFNCIMDYAILARPSEGINRFLNLLNSRKLKLIFSLKDCFEPHSGEWTVTAWKPWTGSREVVRGLVGTFKGHPALLAWYINDEKEEPYLDQIRDHNDLIAQLDPDHPTWQVLMPGQDPRVYLGSSDIIGLDVYPVWQKYRSGFTEAHLDQVTGETWRLSGDTMGSRALWMVLECASFKGHTPNSSPPSYEEMTCLAYQAIACGARGLLFYDFSELRKHDGDAQWQAVKRMAQSISEIAEIALGIDVPPDERVSVSDSRISLVTRSAVGGTWVLAVNSSYTTVPATFKLPAKPGKAARVSVGPPGQPQQPVPLIDGSFRDSIEPTGIRAYRLTYNQVPPIRTAHSSEAILQ